ncbi:MAG: polysaccharide deacetylase family protein [archaeon]|nr:polysaccharide deacetylase family protein [archaeon]
MHEKFQGNFNVDVDTICVLLEAYGIAPKKCENVTFSKIIPRMLKFFAAQAILATFFVVGRYAQNKANKKIFLQMVSEGHEIANHTQSHRPNFSSLTKEQKELEVTGAHNAIWDACAEKPLGFRAPGWDIDSETYSVLEKLGYSYDSSIVPSGFMQWIPSAMNFFNKGKTAWTKIGKPEYASAPKEPYYPNPQKIWQKGTSKVLEIPVSTFSPICAPFYATAFFASHPAFFSPAYALLNNKKYVNFQLHSIDFVDQKNDAKKVYWEGLRHPVLRYSIGERISFFEKAAKKMSEKYEFKTLAQIAEKKSKAGQ